MISSCCLVNSLFYPSFSAGKFSIHFWLKWPLTARIIKKAVSRTLKQSDIVLYAREMQVFAFLRMERLLFKFAKRAATWNEVMHCGGSWTGLLRFFWGFPTFPKASAPAVLNTISRRMPDLCPLSLQLNSSDILWDLWHRNFSQILLFKIWCHYEIWAIMVSLWALSQEILMHWMQLLYQSSSIILRARCLARRCTLVNNDHRHLSPTATRGRDNYSFSCGHCNYIVIDIAPTEDTQLSLST